MKLKSGFSLIELMIATMIAAGLGTTLFFIFNQINSAAQRFDGVLNVQYQAAIAVHQLQKDLAGAFVPMTAFPVPTAKKEQAGKQPAPQNAPEKAEAAQPADTQAEKKKITWQVLEKPFFVGTKDQRFNEMTFITANPLSVYRTPQKSDAKARMVRVIYHLEPEKNNPALFRLIRQESGDLDLAKARTAQSYELARNVKKVMIEVLVEEQSEEKEDGAPASAKKINYSKAQQWPAEEKEGAQKSEQRMMPNMVTITLSLVDTVRNTEETLVFDAVLQADPFTHKPQEPKKAAPAPAKNGTETTTQADAAGKQARRGAPRPNLFEEVRDMGRSLTKKYEQPTRTLARR